jgi:hypothetical protein
MLHVVGVIKHKPLIIMDHIFVTGFYTLKKSEATEKNVLLSLILWWQHQQNLAETHHHIWGINNIDWQRHWKLGPMQKFIV